MARVASQQVVPDPSNQAVEQTPFEAALMHRLDQLRSALGDDGTAQPENSAGAGYGRSQQPRTSRAPLLATHLIAVAAGAFLMWFLMAAPPPAPATTTASNSALKGSSPASPAIQTPAITPVRTQVLDALERWRQAWSGRAVDSYLGMYSVHFTPADGTSRAVWAEGRRNNFARHSKIVVRLHDVQVVPVDERHAKVHFLQDYASDNYTEARRPKSLMLVREDNDWRIEGERQE